MQQIFEGHYERNDLKRNVHADLVMVTDSSRLALQVESEISDAFPILENPMLVMYVFPHVATESRIPIPGYWTAFPMYERLEFALPGEQVDVQRGSN